MAKTTGPRTSHRAARSPARVPAGPVNPIRVRGERVQTLHLTLDPEPTLVLQLASGQTVGLILPQAVAMAAVDLGTSSVPASPTDTTAAETSESLRYSETTESADSTESTDRGEGSTDEASVLTFSEEHAPTPVAPEEPLFTFAPPTEEAMRKAWRDLVDYFVAKTERRIMRFADFADTDEEAAAYALRLSTRRLFQDEASQALLALRQFLRLPINLWHRHNRPQWKHAQHLYQKYKKAAMHANYWSEVRYTSWSRDGPYPNAEQLKQDPYEYYKIPYPCERFEHLQMSSDSASEC